MYEADYRKYQDFCWVIVTGPAIEGEAQRSAYIAIMQEIARRMVLCSNNKVLLDITQIGGRVSIGLNQRIAEAVFTPLMENIRSKGASLKVAVARDLGRLETDSSMPLLAINRGLSIEAFNSLEAAAASLDADLGGPFGTCPIK